MRRLIPIVYVCVFVCVCFFSSCRDQQLTTDSNARLSFSVDSINFDTVFTSIGSSTRLVMVYNPNPNAVRIHSVTWKKGQCFFASLDGENNSTRWQNIDLYGGDSLFLFIRTEIDPYGTNTHPIEVDTLYFNVNGNRQSIAVQAYGMDVEKIRSSKGKSVYNDLTFTNAKPYLIFDTIVVNNTLTIEAGATFYMHNNARIITYGDVKAEGSKDHPIRFMGDRTDYLFPQVPYRVASGQWGGLFLNDTSANGCQLHYVFKHVHLLSGQVGLYSCCKNTTQLSHLILHNARIHNMSAYGVVLENTSAEISNVEISNCASYGLYLCGGTHRIEHISVANYFGYPYTTLNIHSATRQDVAAVFIQSTSFDMAPSYDSIYNSIFTGAVRPAMVIDSVMDVKPEIAGCYLLTDSLPKEWASNNIYGQASDTIFKNTYYKYGEYIYYDFHLAPRSQARRIGLPLASPQLQLDIQNDLDGVARDQDYPDAGCYSNQ